jgi:hypothetical protein
MRIEGKEEIINRHRAQRAGRDPGLWLFVDAEREYYQRDPDGDKLLQYAQKFISTKESATVSIGRLSRVSNQALGLWWLGPGEG